MRKSRHVAPAELDRLELTIRRLLEAHDSWRERAVAAEARVAELEQTLKAVSEGSLDPAALADEVCSLKQRNAEMRERLRRADEAVERMLARLQFVEEVR